MELRIDPAWAMTVFLVSIRLAALFMFNPVFSSLQKLAVVRVVLVLSTAVCLVAAQGPSAAGLSQLGLGGLIAAVASEAATGAALAFGFFAAFGAFAVAGKLLDIQSGLGLGTAFDPVTRAQAPMFATVLTMTAATAFFAMDGHHAMYRGLALSLQLSPPGHPLSVQAMEAMVVQFGLMFSLGVALIAPVMGGLLLLEVSLAIVSRLLPQMNVFMVSAPLKIMVTLGLLAASSAGIGPSMARVFASIFDYWAQVLRHG